MINPDLLGCELSTAQPHNLKPRQYIWVNKDLVCVDRVPSPNTYTIRKLSTREHVEWKLEEITQYIGRPFRARFRYWTYRAFLAWDRFVLWMGWD